MNNLTKSLSQKKSYKKKNKDISHKNNEQYLLDKIKQYQIVISKKNKALELAINRTELLKNKYSKLIDYRLPLGYLVLNDKCIIIEVNNPACKLLNISRAELINQHLSKFVKNNSKNCYYEYIHLLKSTLNHHSCEIEFVNNSDNIFLIQLDSIAKNNHDRLEYQIILSDISERKHKEKMLQTQIMDLINLNLKLSQGNRISAAGELVSTIAHEINQPLMTIVGYIGGCINHLKKKGYSKKVVEVLTNAMDQAERVGKVIHRLKDFVSNGVTHRSMVNINSLIKEVVDLLYCEIRKNAILVRLMLNDKIPEIYVDKIQIFMAIRNVVQNALEAMSSTNNDIKRLFIKTQLCNTNQLLVTIIDNGEGIKESILDKIFEPSFTSKPTGIGLGLAMTNSVIKAHGGKITVKSKANETQFTIMLPYKVYN